ncbi:MAG: 4-hydroxythreonine-4-phosphate dehydrogenase PdxA [Legionellaceae bacterium]|nr:4-hydroxythreonine-4-phosphate dehydrogenase PdxA [Legionellaceae bacterium]
MKPLLVSSGEPAGIGPDLCLQLAGHSLPIVVLGDKSLLQARAKQIGIERVFHDYHPGTVPVSSPKYVTVLSVPCVETPIAGQLNPKNATYVMQLLTTSAERCLAGEFSALVTAPVHKAIINKAGIAFTGHTEFFARYCHANAVVMMLACSAMRVALVTTHLPLKDVASAITPDVLTNVLMTLHAALQQNFGIAKPAIYVAGLNPHAGEDGYLGHEEIDVIIPTLLKLKKTGMNIQGPFPADTMFTTKNGQSCDAFVAMYHDQGLPVIKYADFGHAVNVTLGLPIIRTSVDHGTALDLAGTGFAESSSLIAAVDLAGNMVRNRSCQSLV